MKLRRKTDEIKIKMDYAWNWYSYHANQRMIAFRFFLLIIGIITVGLLQCMESEELNNICYMVSLLAAIISVSFLLLDIRNYEIIICAENDLKKLEDQLDMNILKDMKDRNQIEKSFGMITKHIPEKCIKFLKHQCILRILYFTSVVIFSISTLYCIFEFNI